MRILQKEKRKLGPRRLRLPVDKTRNGISRGGSCLQRVHERRARTKTLEATRTRQRGQMNLLQSDVFNAQNILEPWGILRGNVSSGWHEGQISIIIVSNADTISQGMFLTLLEANTSINIPIVFKKPENEEFQFNFDTAP